MFERLSTLKWSMVWPGGWGARSTKMRKLFTLLRRGANCHVTTTGSLTNSLLRGAVIFRLLSWRNARPSAQPAVPTATSSAPRQARIARMKRVEYGRKHGERSMGPGRRIRKGSCAKTSGRRTSTEELRPPVFAFGGTTPVSGRRWCKRSNRRSASSMWNRTSWCGTHRRRRSVRDRRS